MPTILRADGFRVYFFSNERQEPPHVHVERGGGQAKIWLDPVLLASSAGFAARDLTEVLALVRSRRLALLEAWHGFFGTDGSL